MSKDDPNEGENGEEVFIALYEYQGFHLLFGSMFLRAQPGQRSLAACQAHRIRRPGRGRGRGRRHGPVHLSTHLQA